VTLYYHPPTLESASTKPKGQGSSRGQPQMCKVEESGSLRYVSSLRPDPNVPSSTVAVANLFLTTAESIPANCLEDFEERVIEVIMKCRREYRESTKMESTSNGV